MKNGNLSRRGEDAAYGRTRRPTLSSCGINFYQMVGLRTLSLVFTLVIGAIPNPVRGDLREDVVALASDEMDGRGIGSEGIARAAALISNRFEMLGLEPLGDSQGYLQRFKVRGGTSLLDGNEAILMGSEKQALKLGTDFTPLAASKSGEVRGEVVFVGFGITANDLDHDDYAHLDVSDKIVLILDGDPGDMDKDSPFRAATAYFHREVRSKLFNARRHGALGAMVVALPRDGEGDKPSGPFESGEGSSDSGIAAMRLSPAMGEKMARAWGTSLKDLASRARHPSDGSSPYGARHESPHGSADDSPHGSAPHDSPHGSAPHAGSGAAIETPQPAAPAVEVSLNLRLESRWVETSNIIGKRAASESSRPGSTLIIGAHYDHLGRGGGSSLDPDGSRIHHGADDNASGTAGVLELAARLARRPLPDRDVVFVLFSAEESGLLGSSHMVSQLVETTGSVTLSDQYELMVNFDMIGRMREKTLHVNGTTTAKELEDLVRKAAQPKGLDLALGGDGYGPSDHTSYYAKGLPVLFFFTGAHEQYHRPSDTSDLINVEGMATIVDFAEDLIRGLEGVSLTSVPPNKAPDSASSGTRSRGYGPYFGSIPDFAGSPHGVPLSGARAGSPAAKAGLRGGDVITRFAGNPTKDLHDYTYALRSCRAGDQVVIEVLRDGKTVSLTAVLEERAASRP